MLSAVQPPQSALLAESPYWTSVAKRRLHNYKGIVFYTDPIIKLHLPDDSFDIIYIHYTLHDVPQGQRASIISEFHRIIKPTGRLYIKEPQRANDGMPVEEIEELMFKNGFIKTDSSSKRDTFSGIYHK